MCTILISIHKALASLDIGTALNPLRSCVFQSTRLSRASTSQRKRGLYDYYRFQSTRLSRASTGGNAGAGDGAQDFNPQGSREPRRRKARQAALERIFQSTRLSRASTSPEWFGKVMMHHFNPQGSREPRPACQPPGTVGKGNFNPQGSREPRLYPRLIYHIRERFQSTRLSRAST